MSLVQTVFNYVKQNPGITGIQIQNKIIDPSVPSSIQYLESNGSIYWQYDGYYAMKHELESLKASLDDTLDAVSRIVQDEILKECPRCHKSAQGEDEIRQRFGYRKSKGKTIPQSHCRKCRNKQSNLIVELHDESNIIFHSAEQAKNMRNKINLEGIIIEKEIPRKVNSWRVGPTKVCSAYLVDDYDDKIKITLWDEDIKRIKNGSRIRILNGYSTKFHGEVSVGTGWKGTLEVLYFGERERPKKFFTQKRKPEKFPNQSSISVVDESDLEKYDYLNQKSDFEEKKRDFQF